MPLLSITIGLDPVLLHLGPLAIRWYGLGYLLGIAIGARVAWPYARRAGLTDEQLWQLLSLGVPAGIVGGRLYYVVQNDLGAYLARPAEILAIWHGGMAFFGAIFAALLLVAALARWQGFPLWPTLDAAALFAVLGQAFGRIGNIVNGDVVGYPTMLPWGTAYAHPDSFAPALGVPYQPAAAYELIFNLLFFAALYRWRDRLAPGWLCLTYLAGYCVGQFAIFFLRDNVVIALGLKQAQWTALALLIPVGLAALWLRRHPVAASTASVPAARAGRRR